MYSETILQLIAKQMGNAASDEERLKLNELLQQYPEHFFLMEVLQSIEGEKVHKELTMSEEALMEEGWRRLQDELNKRAPASSTNNDNPKPVVIPVWATRAAVWAGAIILLGGAFLLWKQEGKRIPPPLVTKINQVYVPFGIPEKKLLPDSSEVWVNAGSRIRYAENFVQKKREVYLEGEAFFSVRHDAEHPFIVHAGTISILALGTQFNVQAYPDENRIETTLIKGKVQITMDEKPDQRIILDPNEKLTVTNLMPKLSNKRNIPRKDFSFLVQEITPIALITSISEVAWLQDKLAFQNEAFQVLAKKMERRYKKLLVFKDTVLGNERLNGIFENENIEKALEILQMTTPFRYRINGDSVYLSREL